MKRWAYRRSAGVIGLLGLAASAAAQEAVPPLRLFHREVQMLSGGGDTLDKVFFRGTGVGSEAISTDGLFMLIFWFSAFFFVLLMFLMVYWVIKYRRRPGVAPPVSPSHNTILELVWTIVPSSALLVIFFLGFFTYMDRQIAVSGAYELTIKGKMWAWTPVYHNGVSTQWFLPLDDGIDPVSGNRITSVDTAPVIILPEDTPVRLIMDSADVIHSFWIPDMRVKGDVYPNRYTTYTFRTPRLEPTADVPELTGYRYQDHWIFCAEYCGDKHSEMAAVLRVVPRQVFDQKLIEWDTEGLSPAELGKVVSQQQACFSCHNDNGSQAGAAPTWLNLFGSSGRFADGSTIDFKDENYLRESILVPAAKIVVKDDGGRWSGNMNSYQGQINERQLDGLIAYIKSLSSAGSSAAPPDPAEPDPAPPDPAEPGASGEGGG